jgi:hypothetical protein
MLKQQHAIRQGMVNLEILKRRRHQRFPSYGKSILSLFKLFDKLMKNLLMDSKRQKIISHFKKNVVDIFCMVTYILYMIY